MGDSAYNVLGLPDLELVSQHYETRKHQDGYSYDIIVYAVKHVGYVPYCHMQGDKAWVSVMGSVPTLWLLCGVNSRALVSMFRCWSN